MDPNFAVGVVAVIAIVVPAINWWQNRSIARRINRTIAKEAEAVARDAAQAKDLLAANTVVANDKLDEIHVLVNSRLSDALQTIEDLKALLLLVVRAEVDADDPRVKEAIAKNS